MTTTAAPAYVSGHCSVGAHDRCRGAYAGTTCGCPHHTAPPPEPEPEPVPVLVVRHCVTCTCQPITLACPVFSHGADGWHCAVDGEHQQHRNAAGDVTWTTPPSV